MKSRQYNVGAFTACVVACFLFPCSSTAQTDAGTHNRYVDPMRRFELMLPQGWTYQASPTRNQTMFAGDGRQFALTVGPPRWETEFALGILEDGLHKSVRKLDRLSSERQSYGGYPAQIETFKGSNFKVPLQPDVSEARFFVGVIKLPHAVIMAFSTVTDDLPMDVFKNLLASIRPVEELKKPKKKRS